MIEFVLIIHLIVASIAMYYIYKAPIASSRKQMLYLLSMTIPIGGAIVSYKLIEDWKGY